MLKSAKTYWSGYNEKKRLFLGTINDPILRHEISKVITNNENKVTSLDTDEVLKKTAELQAINSQLTQDVTNLTTDLDNKNTRLKSAENKFGVILNKIFDEREIRK